LKILHTQPPPQSSNGLSTAPAPKQNATGDVPDLASKKRSETTQNESSEANPRVTDIESPIENGPIARKEEVSAEVPKFGVSGESQRASHIEIPTFKKDKA